MADKPDQMPWEDAPFTDRKAAAQTAIAAAQRRPGGVLTPAQHKYAQEAFTRETDALAAAPEGSRNDTLNKAAFALGQLVGAGALNESDVRNALWDACLRNGHIADDGETMARGTIDSGLGDGKCEPRDLSGVGLRAGAFWLDDNAQPSAAVALDRVKTLEAGFWLSRESLQTIYLGALSRMCAPWAVLGFCAARALALVNPHTLLPALIGGPGSLNWFAAIAAPSGGGKGSAAAVARELVTPYVRQRSLGSGEGLIDAYVKPRDKDSGEPAGQYESVMFTADEIDTMHVLSNRTGNTMLSILRSGFSGETLGFSYRSNDRHIESHTYRMTLVVNVQPARAGALLDDQYGGTLQRFMWFPGTDTRISMQTPVMPAELVLPPYTEWQYPQTLKIPGRAQRLIQQERVKAMRGDQEFLDGHVLFIREKFAYALAVLDGRSQMCEADWDLAGVAIRVSDHTREWVAYQLDEAGRADAEKRGKTKAVEYVATEEEKTRITNTNLNRVALWVRNKLRDAENGLTTGELQEKLNSRDRTLLKIVLPRLEERGDIKQEGKRWLERDV